MQELAEFHDMSKTGVLRQALLLYQGVFEHAKKGEQLAFTDREGRLIPVLIVGVGLPFEQREMEEDDVPKRK